MHVLFYLYVDQRDQVEPVQLRKKGKRYYTAKLFSENSKITIPNL